MMFFVIFFRIKKYVENIKFGIFGIWYSLTALPKKNFKKIWNPSMLNLLPMVRGFQKYIWLLCQTSPRLGIIFQNWQKINRNLYWCAINSKSGRHLTYKPDTFLQSLDNSEQDQHRWILNFGNFFYRNNFTPIIIDSERQEATILDTKNHKNCNLVSYSQMICSDCLGKWFQRKLMVGSSRKNILENCERF